MNKDVLKNVQNVLDDMVNTQFAAGASVLVINKGEEQGYFQAGYRDVASGEQITRDTIFRLYSMSKPVTSLAVMILLEQGKIDLLEPVSKYLPCFSKMTCLDERGNITECVTPVTIQQLLNMTSGVSYPGELNKSDVAVAQVFAEGEEKLFTEDAFTTQELVERVAACPLAFVPGSTWQYGFSADVLGALVEAVSGMKFSEFLQKNVFDPLEMKDTGFYVPEEKVHRLARTYMEVAPGKLEEYTGHNLLIQNRPLKAPKFESGGAGLVSTVDDYSHFTQMLMNGGVYRNSRRIIGKKTVDFMTGSYLTNAQQPGFNWDHLGGYSYANLLRVMKWPGLACSVSSEGEYGWDGWLGTYMMNDPKNDLTILMMSQKKDTGTTEYTRRVRNVVMSAM